MIQTQSDRSGYWQHLHSYPYNAHLRGYTSPQHIHHLHHTPLHHSPVHHHHQSVHSPMSPSTHHTSSLLHSSYTTSPTTLTQHTHMQSPGSCEPRTIKGESPTMDGFPTRPQFENLLNEYILSLSPKKRDKALIPQKRYDNILAVLRDPKCTTIESAQFRFWAKKMFRLSTEDSSSGVVCHEGKPVAVREQLYQVLTESHNRAQHGGRDKTSAEVRKHYSWVPKELIARFVRHCPSCTLRRSSPLDYSPLPSRNQDMYGRSVERLSQSPPYTRNMDMAPSPTYSSSSPARSTGSPILRHSSSDSLGPPSPTSLPVTTQSMPQLQAMATMMPTTNGNGDVAYPYSVPSGYGNGMGETSGGSLVTVPNMESHGIYSRAT